LLIRHVGSSSPVQLEPYSMSALSAVDQQRGLLILDLYHQVEALACSRIFGFVRARLEPQCLSGFEINYGIFPVRRTQFEPGIVFHMDHLVIGMVMHWRLLSGFQPNLYHTDSWNFREQSVGAGCPS